MSSPWFMQKMHVDIFLSILGGGGTGRRWTRSLSVLSSPHWGVAVGESLGEFGTCEAPLPLRDTRNHYFSPVMTWSPPSCAVVESFLTVARTFFFLTHFVRTFISVSHSSKMKKSVFNWVQEIRKFWELMVSQPYLLLIHSTKNMSLCD